KESTNIPKDRDGKILNFALKSGDVVVMATDGLFDNFDARKINEGDRQLDKRDIKTGNDNIAQKIKGKDIKEAAGILAGEAHKRMRIFGRRVDEILAERDDISREPTKVEIASAEKITREELAYGPDCLTVAIYKYEPPTRPNPEVRTAGGAGGGEREETVGGGAGEARPEGETLGETAEEETAGPREIDRQVTRRFEKRGFSREDLEAVDGFRELTKGEQILALHNFEQRVLARIEEEAKESYSFADKGILGFLRGKNSQMEEYRKASARSLSYDEAAKKEMLRQVTRDLMASRLDVEVTAKGIKVNYFSEKNITGADGKVDKNALKLVRAYNETADLFAQAPLKWKLPGSATKDAVQYRLLEENYLRAKEGLLAKLETMPESADLINKFEEAEDEVEASQRLTVDPEASGKLSLWWEGTIYPRRPAEETPPRETPREEPPREETTRTETPPDRSR
ncbi:MAG: hypothetical protein Q8O98_01630, partial [bacterium]|nr:hypothetical protein [bacterium]